MNITQIVNTHREQEYIEYKPPVRAIEQKLNTHFNFVQMSVKNIATRARFSEENYKTTTTTLMMHIFALETLTREIVREIQQHKIFT